MIVFYNADDNAGSDLLLWSHAAVVVPVFFTEIFIARQREVHLLRVSKHGHTHSVHHFLYGASSLDWSKHALKQL